MPTNLSRRQAVYLFSAVLISWLGSTVAAQVQREPGQPEAAKESAAATTEKAVRREPWHLITIPDPAGAASHHCGAGVSVGPVRGR